MVSSKIAAIATGLVLALPMAGQALTVSTLSGDFLISGPELITGNPAGIQEWNECYPASDDLSAPARLLADGDWVVTGEASFQGFDLVSFASSATPKGNGRCEFHDGRIAIWQDGAFIALIEEAVADRFLIGHIQPVDGTRIEIRSGSAEPATSGFVAYDAATEELFLTGPDAP